MRYVILSVNTKAGISDNDSGNLSQYFELGWELIISRLYLIHLIAEKFIDPIKDIIVTNDSRQFLYNNFCKTVISYETFLTINLTTEDTVFNIPYFLEKTFPYEKNIAKWPWYIKNNENYETYHYTVEQIPDIVSFDLLPTNNVIKNNSKYICLVVRKRDHVKFRSHSEEQIESILKFAESNKLTTYVMGKSCENYTNISKNIFHVNLQEMATLINGNDCKGMITPLSGGGMIRLFTGKCKTVVFDTASEHNKVPLMWGPGANFSNLSDTNFKIHPGFDINVLDWLI